MRTGSTFVVSCALTVAACRGADCWELRTCMGTPRDASSTAGGDATGGDDAPNVVADDAPGVTGDGNGAPRSAGAADASVAPHEAAGGEAGTTTATEGGHDEPQADAAGIAAADSNHDDLRDASRWSDASTAPDASSVQDGGADAGGQPSDPGANAPSCVLPRGEVLRCNGESCCTSIIVPSGQFMMGRGSEDCGAWGCQPAGNHNGCPANLICYEAELPEHSMRVTTFALDKYEVTVGRFRRFVEAYGQGWRPQVGSGANPNVSVGGTAWQVGWDDSAIVRGNYGPSPNLPPTDSDLKSALLGDSACTWTDTPLASDERAINCVNWFEAFAFCIWDGGRLPTEAEWEYAAAGGDRESVYPWGNAYPVCSLANYGTTGCGEIGVRSVGSRNAGNGRWGHADLAGNVAEWVLDWSGSYAPSQADNFANTVQSGAQRQVRGGAYAAGDAASLRATYRNYSDAPRNHVVSVGFRCARSAAW